jgi:predicted ATPase with chaperone activity
MVGSPGSGKTLLASALSGILPKISIDEALVGARLFQFWEIHVADWKNEYD